MVLKPEITQTDFNQEHKESKQLDCFDQKMSDESQEQVSSAGDEDLSNESQFSENAVVTRVESRPFKGIPKEWHETIQVKHKITQRVKLYFKCMHSDCKSIFKKSCNLRDHFRKHTGQRPYDCPMCHKTFTQSGNLGRHLKNVHKVPRDAQSSHIAAAQAGMFLNDTLNQKRRHQNKAIQQKPDEADATEPSFCSASHQANLPVADLTVKAEVNEQTTTLATVSMAESGEKAKEVGSSAVITSSIALIQPVGVIKRDNLCSAAASSHTNNLLNQQSMLERDQQKSVEQKNEATCGRYQLSRPAYIPAERILHIDLAAEADADNVHAASSAHVLSPMGPRSPRCNFSGSNSLYRFQDQHHHDFTATHQVSDAKLHMLQALDKSLFFDQD